MDLYTASTTGLLAEHAAYKAGAGQIIRQPSDQNKKRFSDEKRFWIWCLVNVAFDDAGVDINPALVNNAAPFEVHFRNQDLGAGNLLN